MRISIFLHVKEYLKKIKEFIYVIVFLKLRKKVKIIGIYIKNIFF